MQFDDGALFRNARTVGSMTEASRYDIRFIVGARKLFAVPRRLVPVGWTLEELLDRPRAALPDCGGADGYRLNSVPAQAVDSLLSRHQDWLVGGRRDYARHFICMDGSFEDYLARFSGKTRSTLRRKARKFAEAGDGTLSVGSYRSPAEIAEFLRLVRPLDARTYQARLLGAGLPQGQKAERDAMQLAADDRLRAFLLFLGPEPVAYLYLPVEGQTLVYSHLGYSPEHAQLSPGTVLQLAALEQLFAERRFRYFDFTEGDGDHKAKFGTDSVDCASFVLLRPALPNRLLLGSLALFDSGVAVARTVAEKAGGIAAARRLLRG
jgi:hypothetical protein